DTIAPTLVSAVADTDTQVTLTFSERLDLTSAGTAGNYTINGVAVNSAVVQPSGQVVVLAAATPMAPCATSTVQISHVRDRSQNSTAPNPATATVAAPITLIPNNDGFIWKYSYSSADLGTLWREP